MFFIIKGDLDLLHFFYAMLASTCLLVAVVAASYFLPFNKPIVISLMTLLSIIAVGSSAKVISMVYK